MNIFFMAWDITLLELSFEQNLFEFLIKFLQNITKKIMQIFMENTH